MEKGDKGSRMIWMGVCGWMFLLVPAYPGCPGSKAVKRSLLLLLNWSGNQKTGRRSANTCDAVRCSGDAARARCSSRYKQTSGELRQLNASQSSASQTDTTSRYSDRASSIWYRYVYVLYRHRRFICPAIEQHTQLHQYNWEEQEPDLLNILRFIVRLS